MITIMTTPLKTTEENNLKLQTLTLQHCFNILGSVVELVIKLII